MASANRGCLHNASTAAGDSSPPARIGGGSSDGAEALAAHPSYRPHNSFDAIRAPSASASSFAHCTDGWQRTML